jgi:hypothetical protein
MAGYCPLEIKRGEGRTFEFEFFQSDEVTPLDISTWNFWGDIKSSANSGVVKSFTTGVKPNTINILTLKLTGQQAEDIPTSSKKLTEVETYWYDVKGNPPGGEPEYLLEGPFAVKPRVTV